MDIGRLPSGGKAQRVLRIFSAPIGALILLILSVVASQGYRLKGASWAQAPDGVTESIGKLLFTKYMLPFEALTLLLLAAVVAAVYLARRREADK